MDSEDSAPTPRSGRKKKSSALSRLAAQKGKSKSDSPVHTLSYNGQGDTPVPKYPIDANVEIQNTQEEREEEDSDEGIGMAHSTYKSSPGAKTKNGSDTMEDSFQLDSSSSSTIKKFKHLKMDSAIEEDIETGERRSYPQKLRGEKRFRDTNSSGEDLAADTGRINSKKYSHSESDVQSSDELFSDEVKNKRNVKDASKSHIYSKDVMEVDTKDPIGSPPVFLKTNKGASTDIVQTAKPTGSRKGASTSDDLLKQYQDSDSLSVSPQVNQLDKTFTLKGSKGQSLTDRYCNVLVDQEARDLDSQEKSELYDGLGDLRPGPSSSPPPPVSRNYSGSSLQANVLNSLDRPPIQRLTSASTDAMSQASYQSTSVLPQILTKNVKDRSFLVGSMGSRTSLLGSEELDRLFPERKMKVYVCTWNMCEMKDLPESLDDFLLPDVDDFIPDTYVVTTQESTPNRKEWEIRLQETLGPNHVLFHSAAFGVLYLSIFIRRDLIWFCSVSEEANVSTRVGPSGIKTKGAVAVSFNFFGSSFLFVNSHLTPHDGKAKERAADFHKINNGLNLPKNSANKNSPSKKKKNAAEDDGATSRYDFVFWSGDLNFRLEKERDRLDKTIEGIEAQELPNFTDLMVHDELFRIRNEELAFQDFQEGRIKFKPTYKYDIGTDKFDTSKKMRIPSYTDRILFRCKKKNAISCLHYGAVETLKESDHRPVFGVFEVELRAGRDNIPLSGGQFEREIWLEGNRRRAEKFDNKKPNEKQSSVCSLQ